MLKPRKAINEVTCHHSAMGLSSRNALFICVPAIQRYLLIDNSATREAMSPGKAQIVCSPIKPRNERIGKHVEFHILMPRRCLWVVCVVLLLGNLDEDSKGLRFVCKAATQVQPQQHREFSHRASCAAAESQPRLRFARCLAAKRQGGIARYCFPSSTLPFCSK